MDDRKIRRAIKNSIQTLRNIDDEPTARHKQKKIVKN